MFKGAFLGRNPSHFRMNSFVRAFIVADSLLWAGWNFTAPIFAIFVANDVAGGGIELAASGFSVHLIVRVVFELVSGKFLQGSQDRKKILLTLFGIFVVGFAFLGFGFTKTPLNIYLFYALAGAGLGIASPAKNSLFSMHLDKNREATEWGMYDAAIFTGMAFSAALGGFIAEKYGFQTLFIVTAVSVWASLIPYLLYVKSRPKAE